MLKWILTVGLGVVGLVAGVAIIGWMMPREHVASSAAVIQQPPERVWEAVRDLAAAESWWPDVERSERVDDERGREVYRHVQKSGYAMSLVVAEANPPSMLVTEIDATANAPFGGTWTYRIEPTDRGSRVTITEDGWIANPFFRFMANLVFGMHGTMDSYLEALGRRFGEAVTPLHQR